MFVHGQVCLFPRGKETQPGSDSPATHRDCEQQLGLLAASCTHISQLTLRAVLHRLFHITGERQTEAMPFRSGCSFP